MFPYSKLIGCYVVICSDRWQIDILACFVTSQIFCTHLCNWINVDTKEDALSVLTLEDIFTYMSLTYVSKILELSKLSRILELNYRQFS